MLIMFNWRCINTTTTIHDTTIYLNVLFDNECSVVLLTRNWNRLHRFSSRFIVLFCPSLIQDNQKWVPIPGIMLLNVTSNGFPTLPARPCSVSEGTILLSGKGMRRRYPGCHFLPLSPVATPGQWQPTLLVTASWETRRRDAAFFVSPFKLQTRNNELWYMDLIQQIQHESLQKTWKWSL